MLKSRFGIDKPHNEWRKAQQDSGIRNSTNSTSQMKWIYGTCKRSGWCLLPLTKPELHISELDKCGYKCKLLGFCSSVANVSNFWDPTQHIWEISFRCFETQQRSHLEAPKRPRTIGHFNLQTWNHFVVSKCLETSSQWHSVMSQNRSSNNILSFCKSE
jgi:hypothetical protein